MGSMTSVASSRASARSGRFALNHLRKCRPTTKGRSGLAVRECHCPRSSKVSKVGTFWNEETHRPLSEERAYATSDSIPITNKRMKEVKMNVSMTVKYETCCVPQEG